MGRRARCLTFDLFGTLIDVHGGISQALLALPALEGNAVLAARIARRREGTEKGMLVSAVELPDEDSPAERYETPDWRSWTEILADSLVRAADEEGVLISPSDAALVASSHEGWDPFPEVRAILRQLAERFTLGLLANSDSGMARLAARRLGVRFAAVVTAEDVGSYKPAPDHWYAAMHEMEVDEDDLLHLAASPFQDLETASLLGIRCGWVHRTEGEGAGLAAPDFEVPDLASALPRLLTLARPSRPPSR